MAKRAARTTKTAKATPQEPDRSTAPITTEQSPGYILTRDHRLMATTASSGEGTDGLVEPVEPASALASTPLVGEGSEREGEGNDPFTPESGAPAGSSWPAEVAAIARERLPGEKRPHYWERMRKAARTAGLPRGQEPGSAYVWATEVTAAEFDRPPEPELPVEPEPPVVEPADDPAPATAAPPPAQEPAANLGVAGLGDIPESWPVLPANATLQAEISWVSANRLRVRDGNGVDLSRALSPAPSYSALSWLETSILFPAKFSDISVKATASQDDETEHIRREKFAIEEIRSILKEMLEAR